ncbi:hypothetical protein DSECCO2_477400 [anaerobic digester metagenome]
MCELALVKWLVKVTGGDCLEFLLTTGPMFSLSSRKVPNLTPSALEILISDDSEGIFSLLKISSICSTVKPALAASSSAGIFLPAHTIFIFSVTGFINFVNIFYFRAQNYKSNTLLANIILI